MTTWVESRRSRRRWDSWFETLRSSANLGIAHHRSRCCRGLSRHASPANSFSLGICFVWTKSQSSMTPKFRPSKNDSENHWGAIHRHWRSCKTWKILSRLLRVRHFFLNIQMPSGDSRVQELVTRSFLSTVRTGLGGSLLMLM